MGLVGFERGESWGRLVPLVFFRAGRYTTAVIERVPDSLCQQCQHRREVKTPRSTFLMCLEGTPPKYPLQPVRRCVYFVRREEPTSP